MFVLSFSFRSLFPVVQTLFVLGLVLVLVDIMLLYGGEDKVKVRRELPKVFSLGDLIMYMYMLFVVVKERKKETHKEEEK